MSAALEAVGEEGVDDIKGEAGADNSRAHAEDVSVVVESGHLRRVGVGAERRADALVLIRAHRHTDARTADENTEGTVKISFHLLAYSVCKEGIVAGCRAVSTAVNDLVALLFEVGNNLALECVAR